MMIDDKDNNLDDEKKSNDVNQKEEQGAEQPESPLSEQELEEIKEDEATIYKQQAANHFDKYVRAVAELDNYQKRATKERAELIKYSGESLARDLLSVLDDFDRALNHIESGVDDNFAKGIQMIYDNLLGTLRKHGVVHENSIGKKFDPQKHEAMSMIPVPDKESGTVVEEIKKLYLLKDRVLRPAQVVVATEMQDSEDSSSDKEQE